MSDVHQKHLVPGQHLEEQVDFDIYKLQGINQYFIRTGGMDINFILEEDAQKFARKMTGINKTFNVREIK